VRIDVVENWLERSALGLGDGQRHRTTLARHPPESILNARW
jgi:hypothetical protein